MPKPAREGIEKELETEKEIEEVDYTWSFLDLPTKSSRFAALEKGASSLRLRMQKINSRGTNSRHI